MLTPKQHELLNFIRRSMAGTGVAPSYEEMAAAINVVSKSGVHRLIVQLEKRGFIRRLPHRARAIEVIRIPDPLRDSDDPATLIAILGDMMSSYDKGRFPTATTIARARALVEQARRGNTEIPCSGL